jgi:hypothetical protein
VQLRCLSATEPSSTPYTPQEYLRVMLLSLYLSTGYS